jgi:probable HAF family extracellular repeat protein
VAQSHFSHFAGLAPARLLNTQLKTLIGTLAGWAALAAPAVSNTQHHHYKLVDMGTFGGPSSYVNDNFRTVNNRGNVVGSSQTTISQSPTSNYFICIPNPAANPVVNKAFEWRDGAVHDLGALYEGGCSNAIEISANGRSVGASEFDAIDPLTGVNEGRAVIWKNDHIRNLGTLGGNQSVANSINSLGQVTGFALNAVADPYSMMDAVIFNSSNGTQTRAFIWEDGKMRDIGTLGGPDAYGFYVNEKGQVAGISYTTGDPSSATGFPEVHPFLWDHGRMHDLGSFGGSGIPIATVFVNGLNNRGEVIGGTATAGDQTLHPFLWDGTKLIDMATQGKGGSFFAANKINDHGMVAGALALPNQNLEAGIWNKGIVTHLGFLPGDCDSEAWSVSSGGQVGGVSVSCDGLTWRAFLWEHGSMVDLNTLISPGSSLQLLYPITINERGEISGNGVPKGFPTSGDQSTHQHAFLLIPCDEDHADIEGCDYDAVEAERTVQVRPAQIVERLAPSSGLYRYEVTRRIQSPRK